MITYKLVKEVKKMAKKQWHDKVWHEFFKDKEVEAIDYALEHKVYGDTIKDIILEAKKYIKAIKD